MEKGNFIMFCLGALSLAVGLVVMPYVNQLWDALKSRIRRKKTYSMNDDVEHLKEIVRENSKHIMELGNQIDNIAERLSIRERNRKSNTRRDVREYLAELRDEK